jgi:hypothetical protein
MLKVRVRIFVFQTVLSVKSNKYQDVKLRDPGG